VLILRFTWCRFVSLCIAWYRLVSLGITWYRFVSLGWCLITQNIPIIIFFIILNGLEQILPIFFKFFKKLIKFFKYKLHTETKQIPSKYQANTKQIPSK
jgi:hypothetical protein